MLEIRRKPGFLARATWLIACSEGYVGTVQGVIDQAQSARSRIWECSVSYRGMGLG